MIDRLGQLLECSSEKVTGKIIDNHVILDIVEADLHYWSPQLNFRIEINEEDPSTSIIAGLIGPRPAVWSLFMFIYFLVGVIGFFVSSYGVAKLILGEYSNLILAFPIAIIFMLTAYSVGKYGEKLANDQTEILKQFVRDAIKFDQEILENRDNN